MNTAWRMLLTAYCFVQFAVQVLWLGKWVMPRLMRSAGDEASKRRRALFQAHRHVRFYLATLRLLGLVSFEFRGEPIREPAVVVANHPSLLDFIVLLRDFPNAVCLYKSQTRDNPVLADFVDVAGYIEGMDGTREVSQRIIDTLGQRLQEGHHVVLFPEGTRSNSSTAIGRFRSTGFHAVIKSRVAVQPVVVYCKPLFLGKHQSWAAFSRRRNHMIIEYLPPLDIGQLPKEMQNAKGLAEGVRKTIKTRLLELDGQESNAE